MHRTHWIVFTVFIMHEMCAAPDVCNKTGPCSCTNSKGKIDLSPLASSTGAKFKDVKEETGDDLFSYNPCNDFSEGGDGCIGVAACQIQVAEPNRYYNLGSQASAKFVTNQDNSVQIEYIADTGFKRTAEVKLVCEESTEFKFDVTGETTPGRYVMTLTSKYACPTGGPGPGTGGTISVGTILLIVFISLAFVYVILGVVFQSYVRKAEGRERIPNYTFWTSLPGYIKDGAIFVVRRGKNGKSYDNI